MAEATVLAGAPRVCAAIVGQRQHMIATAGELNDANAVQRENRPRDQRAPVVLRRAATATAAAAAATTTELSLTTRAPAIHGTAVVERGAVLGSSDDLL